MKAVVFHKLPDPLAAAGAPEQTRGMSSLNGTHALIR
jgi:hypothetical protein